MMGRYLAAGTALMCAVSLGTVVLAERPNVRRSSSSGADPALAEATGTIRSLDSERRTVSLRASSGTLRLQIREWTTIFIEGRVGSISDLSEGQTVRATYEPHPDAPVADWLEVQ